MRCRGWLGEMEKALGVYGMYTKHLPYPNAPCREYLPTLGSKWPHSRGNVGKYSMHGASGLGFQTANVFGGMTGPQNRPIKHETSGGIWKTRGMY